MTTATTRPVSSPLRGRILNLGYIGFDLRRNLRMFSSLFFTIVLPLAMYLIFGAMQEYSTTELPNGRGNVSGHIMISMAVYGAITATTSQAGTAAVELQQGWGRQIGLTPFTQAGYILSKTIVALVIALLPITVIFIVGAFTTAQLAAWLWPTAAALILLGSVVFALYGLAFGMLFRSESAVGAASGLVVIMMFLGNAFVPLSGFMLEMAPFTPVWGISQLALWPLSEGVAISADPSAGLVEYSLWMPLLNIVVWAAIFGLLAVFGARRGTSRR